jgi:DNA-binding NtrC family response regulator
METERCILIVEDNEVVRDMLAVALQAYGYGAATAATVHEAVAVMQQHGPSAIGLVIADINLTSDREAREGYALYQRWTTTHPRLAYLLTSGDQTNAALPAIRDGVVAFLAKPFELTELLDTVQALLREHTHDAVPGGMLLISNSTCW